MRTSFFLFAAAVLGATATLADAARVPRQFWPGPGRPVNPFFGFNPWQPFPGFPARDPSDSRSVVVPGGGGGGGRANGSGSVESEEREDVEGAATTAGTIHAGPENCSCPSTPQFNPVCGTDGNTYRNAGLLRCYIRCGANVAQRRMGSC